jgi:WD40 repeat protein
MPMFSIANEPNILTEQQEEWVGDILDPQIRRAFHTIDDPGRDYLDKLARRLLEQLPESKIHYSFTIIDLPENESFGIPGGRIYISRKIIALAQNEDELAGLLGHEIGHIITRQAAIDLTREFQNVLGVNKLGDRKDIIEQWNRLLDLAATKPDSFAKKRREDEQLIADRVALYAMARAGYQPSRFVDFFDRLAQTKSNKGSFWTNLFGRTSSDEKRLRELARSAATMPPACLKAEKAGGPEQFEQWRKAVFEARFAVAREVLPGIVARKALNPPLRSDLLQLRFSPDGRYLLAQDDSSVYVLTANPVTNLFTIDAPDAHFAQFTPDSAAVVLYDKELRVEKWAIAGGQRTSVHQVAMASTCVQTSLSHSGNVLACVSGDGQVDLVDVDANAQVMSTRKIHSVSKPDNAYSFFLSVVDIDAGSLFNIQFSPDDRYFLVANRESALAYDLRTRSELNLPRKIRDITGVSCVFTGADTIAGFSYQKGQTLERLKFPSGELVDQHIEPRLGKLRSADKGDYLVLQTIADNSVTVISPSDARSVMVYKKPAFAIYGDIYASETASGEVGVYNLADKKYLGGIDLPDSPLNAARAVAISSDGKWLAISGRSRGAIWKMESGERALLTWNFEGAFFDGDQLLAKCPKPTGQLPGVFKFDTATNKAQGLYPLPPGVATLALAPFVSYFYPSTWQMDDLLVRVTPQVDKRIFTGKYLMEVFDLHDNHKLWERSFEKERPNFYYSGSGKTLTLVVANYEAMKIEAKRDPQLSLRLDALKDETRRKDSYIVLVVEAATGKPVGSILVDTGKLSFKVRAAFSTADTVIVTDSDQRSLVYSLKSGEQRGKVFGFTRALSSDGKSMLVSRGKNDLVRYDAGSLQASVPLNFPSPIGHVEFSADSSNIYVITYDQSVYSLKTPPIEQQNGVDAVAK